MSQGNTEHSQSRTYSQPHQTVEHTDHPHGQHVEEQRGDLHDPVVDPQGRDHGAGGGAGHHGAIGEVLQGDAVGTRVGQGEEHGEQPEGQDGPEGPAAGAGQLGTEGVADGHVALGAQRGHTQHRRQAHRLEESRLQVAAHGPQQEGVVAPHLVDLQGHAEKQHQQVRHRQAEQVVVGRGLHAAVLEDDEADQEVAHHPDQEDHRVHQSHG